MTSTVQRHRRGRRSVLRAIAPLLFLLASIGSSGCGQAHLMRGKIAGLEKPESSRAKRRCDAPRELALAKSHLRLRRSS
jgi:hypothetical protein